MENLFKTNKNTDVASLNAQERRFEITLIYAPTSKHISKTNLSIIGIRILPLIHVSTVFLKFPKFIRIKILLLGLIVEIGDNK